MSEEQPPTPESHEPALPNAEEGNQPVEPPTDSVIVPDGGSEVGSSENEDWEIVEEMLPPTTEDAPNIAVPSAEAPIPASSSAPQSQTLQTLQQLWQSTQPKLRVGTIRVLKTTIHVLEGTVAQLEAGSTEAEAESSTTEPLTLPNWLTDSKTTLQQGWQRFWTWWTGILPNVRGILPAAVNEVLSSDRALSGAIAGILILVLWVTSSLFSSKPPEQVAIAPSSKSAPAKPTPVKEKKEPKSKNLPEVKVVPPPAPKAPPKAEPAKPQTDVPNPPSKPTPAPTATPSPVSSPSPAPTPKPTPTPPPLKLTPEQTLIARIQDQVAEVSDQYVNGLIQSVQANFRASRLTVKMGDGWYNLLTPQQDSLANDVLKRAQQLNFIKLEMVDAQGNLLARSPVIGSEMVVLKRSLVTSASVKPPLDVP